MKHRRLRRHMAVGLALTLLAAYILPAAAKSIDNVGIIRATESTPLGTNAAYVKQTIEHTARGSLNEYYYDWAPGSNLTPIAVTDGSLNSTQTIAQVSSMLKAQGKDPVAGINGDFFTLSTGVPQGVFITDGIVRCSARYYTSIGFTTDGKAFMGMPQMSAGARVASSNAYIGIHAINHTRDNSGVYLYTSDFASTTKTTREGVIVTLATSGQIRLGQPLTATVTAVKPNTTVAEPLSAGVMVLTAQTGTADEAALRALVVGDTLTIHVNTADERWVKCAYALSGYQRLLTDGVLETSFNDSSIAPRTAVGVRADGSCVFYVVDGRSSSSAGMTLSDLAKRMKALGCVDAVNLDGGGSSAMQIARPGDAIQTVNVPSDGALRGCANYLFLVNTTPTLGTLAKLHLYPTRAILVKGQSSALTLRATDANNHAVTAPSSATWSSTQTTVATVDASGRVTAIGGGTTTVNAASGSAGGAMTVEVINQPDTMTVTDKATGKAVTALTPTGGQTVTLNTVITYDDLRLSTANGGVTYTVNGPIGTISAAGVFTVARQPGASGNVIVTSGDMTQTIPVTIGRAPILLEDFEAAGALAAGTASFSLAKTAARDWVARGSQSGVIAYDFSRDHLAFMRLTYEKTIVDNPSHLNLWLKGDGSCNILGVTVKDANGVSHDLTVALLDFSDIELMQVALPANTVQLSGFYIMRANDNMQSGVLSVDQLMVTYGGAYNDTIAPTIDALTVVEADAAVTITGKVSDDLSVSLPRESLSVTVDGQTVDYTYDTLTGSLLLTIDKPLAAGLHMAVVEAVDASGNRTRRSVEFELSRPTTPIYDDITGNWARKYIQFLGERDIVTAENQLGMLYYRPDNSLTRGDMAVYIARLLGVDVSKYTNYALPYADVASIPAGIYREVAAMYDMGIITGASRDGKLYFDAAASITRGDFMTILGRTLPKGYQGAALKYADADTIPSYMREHISVLTALGVVSGNTQNQVQPYSTITRAEAAKILCWLY